MPDFTAKRTLVKSPPELWEELSEVDRLAKHLAAFGEISITKLEPEHTVAWEGEHASGSVSIEPSGWGTRVTLRAELPEVAAPEPEPEPEPEPAADPPRRGLWARVFGRRRAVAIAEEPPPDPVAEAPDAAEPEPDADQALDPEHARVILDEALDTLGAAHHRPFSRG